MQKEILLLKEKLNLSKNSISEYLDKINFLFQKNLFLLKELKEERRQKEQLEAKIKKIDNKTIINNKNIIYEEEEIAFINEEKELNYGKSLEELMEKGITI